jgi:hypothetical protein
LKTSASYFRDEAKKGQKKKPERLETLLQMRMDSLLPSTTIEDANLVLYHGKLKFPGLNARLAEVKHTQFFHLLYSLDSK